MVDTRRNDRNGITGSDTEVSRPSEEDKAKYPTARYWHLHDGKIWRPGWDHPDGYVISYDPNDSYREPCD